MKDIDTVLEVLVDNAQLSVERIATKTLEKLKSWNKDMFPEPRLYSMHFGEDEEDSEDEEEEEEEDEEDTEAQDAAVQTLRTSRARLMESVDDPLAEAVAAAANASSPRGGKRAVSKTLQTQSDDEEDEEEDEPRKPAAKKSSSKKRKRQGESLLKKKKSATKLSFDDDDDDDEDIPDPPEDGTLLSDLPERAAAAKSSRKTPKKSPKRTQVKSYAGRRVWTDQEKRAVKEGIRHFGLGKWADIKGYYEVILQYRTSTQIKDCYRTMAKRNELGDVLDTE